MNRNGLKPKFVVTSICLLLTSITVVGQSIPSVSVERIVSAAIAAVGSPADLQKIKSIYVIADCLGPKGDYTTKISSFRDSKTSFEQTYSYRNPSSVFINGDVAWERDGETGEYTIASPFQRMVSRMHEYQKMTFDLRSFFTYLELAGDEVFDGRPSNRISAKNELGMPVILYFDKANKRLIGYKLSIPNSVETVTNIFSEWRKIGRLMLPTVVTAIDRSGEWKLSFRTIRLNAADPDQVKIPPRVVDMIEILRMHAEQRTAHLTYDADLLIGDSPERPTTIQRGDVVKRTRAEDLARFKAYFGSFKFLEWEDIVPPVITISKDGTLATKIVRKRVRGISKDKDGEETTEQVIYAWLEVLEKIDGKWRLITIASTEKVGNE